MKRIIEFELQDSPKIAADIDFKGEVIRADEEALKKEYDSGYNDGYASGNAEGYDRGLTEGYANGHADGALPTYYIARHYSMYQDVAVPVGYELNLRIKKLDAIQYAFYRTTGLKSIKIASETGKGYTSYAFRQTAAEVIDLSEMVYQFQDAIYLFYNASNLRSVYGELDFSLVTGSPTSWLDGCKLLEDIGFKAGTIKVSIDFYWCGNLSAESIESIINGLADLTGSTAQKVSLHTATINKLTTEQMDRITAKNWVLN